MECLICGSKKPKLIQSTRVQSFQEASEQRGDGLSEKLPAGELHFTCHKNCISTYCSKHHIERCLRKRKMETSDAPSPKKLRGNCTFNFLHDCFFCGQECTVSRPRKNPSRWREAYLCRTSDEGKTTSKKAILRCAHERNDAWGREVAFRANLAVSDLHAADARYHRDCLARFFTNRPSAGGSSTEACDSAFDELLTQMSMDFTRIWNSVELHSLYSELGGTLLSRRSLIKSVQEHFHSNLLVLSSPGVASILVFRGKASDHLRIVEDAEDDCDAAISKVAKRIRQECQQVKTDGNTYATRISMNSALAECSNSLLTLLSEISPKLDSTVQAAMIGNIVMSVVNSRATCLQISLGVLLNQKRKLVDQFHDFGVTSSYNELRRFKISCASTMANSPRLGLFDSKKGLVQVVADNYDTEISSQNGQKSTHGLAMIITQAGQPKPESANDIPEIPTIKRLKWDQTKTSSLTLGEVNVQRYHGSKKPEMPMQYGMKVVPTLVFLASGQISLDRAAFEDFSFLRQVTGDTPSPEYSGFNTKRARENGQQPGHKTGIVYTPFLDMVPAEPDTMKTAMVEAQRLTILTGQKWTVFTNDQQLYQVAVSITWVDRDMFSMFVPRLGGMHMMMSFVGAVGTLMRGSGLEEILKSTFAGVPKLLSGKKFPQNVRALRIVTEELLRPLLDYHQELHSTKELTEYLALESQKSNTTKLWVDCLIKPVLIMMKFVRAEREGDWPLHLCAVEEMLPYFFASSHVNYARYGLYYLRSMQRLHPTLLNKFMAGEHVRMAFGMQFGQISLLRRPTCVMVMDQQALLALH